MSRKERALKYEQFKKLAPAALGKVKADMIFKNCRIVDVFTGEVVEGNIGVKDGIIVGVSKSLQGKKEIDLGGAYIAPGFIDAHLHLESTMVAPAELVVLVSISDSQKQLLFAGFQPRTRPPSGSPSQQLPPLD